MTTTPNDQTADPAVATPPAADPPAGSAFAAVAATETPAPLPLHERIPEKYRVSKEDGAFDLEASTAKLVDAYGHLEKRLGSGDAPPKSPEEYVPKVEKIDFDSIKDDPEYHGWLKGAHARGMTNEQVGYVLDSFAERMASQPQGMSAEEFQQEMLANHWKTPQEYTENMAAGLRAIRAYAPDITAEELAGLPNHPAIAKILAEVGKELGEDKPVRVAPLSAADFDTQVAALQASEAYNSAQHPEHAQAVAKMQELFAKRYPPNK